MAQRTGSTFLLILAFLLLGAWRPSTLQAQAFDCRVSVNYSTLSGSDYSFLGDLDERIEAYINQNTWTDDQFLDYERIDCRISIFFQEAISLTNFKARLVVAFRRPIYGTTQSSPVVRFSNSEWQFPYTKGTPLVADIRRFNPLTSMLDFYVFLMLGYDYDTFSPLGGTPYFERARQIVEIAQTQGAAGWSQLGSGQQRADLITQLLDSRFQPLRKAYFTYHFKGLDRFATDTEAAREAMLDVLETLQVLYEDVSRSYAIDLFFATKYEELAAIFHESSLSAEAFNLLRRLDPAHLSAYNQLVE